MVNGMNKGIRIDGRIDGRMKEDNWYGSYGRKGYVESREKERDRKGH